MLEINGKNIAGYDSNKRKGKHAEEFKMKQQQKKKPNQEIKDNKEHSHKLMWRAVLVAYGRHFLLEYQTEPLPKKKKK